MKKDLPIDFQYSTFENLIFKNNNQYFQFGFISKDDPEIVFEILNKYKIKTIISSNKSILDGKNNKTKISHEFNSEYKDIVFYRIAMLPVKQYLSIKEGVFLKK
jgi:hypothetical protein